MIWARRRVRIADWLMFAAFAAAAMTAQRNTILAGLIAPIMLAAYLPWPWDRRWRAAGALPFALAALLAIGIGTGLARGSFFQLRTAEWKIPKGAADFLAAHHITGPMFNTYEYGGYLIWRLWPEQRTFIDGRALSESVFQDYARILYNHDASDGLPSGEDLLNRYGVQVIVMNTFEYATGPVYLLAPALADPAQTAWKLVYNDAQALVFMRTPPPGVQPLNSLDVLTHMEDECGLHLEHEPRIPTVRAKSRTDLRQGRRLCEGAEMGGNLSGAPASTRSRSGAGLPAFTRIVAPTVTEVSDQNPNVRKVRIRAPTVREGLVVPQMTRVYSKPDDELCVGLIAPQADVLDGKIDGEGVRHLVFHAFEQRDLAAVAGGFFVEPVHVRRQVAERTVWPQAESIPGADVESAGGIGGRRIGSARPGEAHTRAAASHIVACDGGGAGARARVAAQQIADLRRDGDIQLFPVVHHAGGGAADAVAEMIHLIVGERIEAGAELGASPPDVGALRVKWIAVGNVKLPSVEKAPPHSISMVPGSVIRVLTCRRLRRVIAGARWPDEVPLT